jgi:proline iminopeptidase
MKLSLPRRRNLDTEASLPWKCDNLTPDLCNDLIHAEGVVQIRGIDVHYWRYESSSSTSSHRSGGVPIIVIHGGPGFPHNYMLPLKQQACRGRPVYFYDQAGCGKSIINASLSSSSSPSSSVANEYPWLLTTEYYSLEELPALIEHWDLRDYHIIGNSWGTVLSQFFALDARADALAGLRSMVLSGPLSDAGLYVDSQWSQEDGTLGSLPIYVQDRIRFLEGIGAYGSREYQDVVEVLTSQFTIRTAPYPDCFVDSSDTMNQEIYVGMQGESEFTVGGTLKTLNITNRLVDIRVPVLLSHGKYDTMRPAVVQAMLDKLPLAESVQLNRSGHISMIDEPREMNDAVADFFDRVEQGYRPSRQAGNGILIPLDELFTNVPIVLLILMLLFCVVAALRSKSKVRRETAAYTLLT